jgi:hypothetical protein
LKNGELGALPTALFVATGRLLSISWKDATETTGVLVKARAVNPTAVLRGTVNCEGAPTKTSKLLVV